MLSKNARASALVALSATDAAVQEASAKPTAATRVRRQRRATRKSVRCMIRPSAWQTVAAPAKFTVGIPSCDRNRPEARDCPRVSPRRIGRQAPLHRAPAIAIDMPLTVLAVVGTGGGVNAARIRTLARNGAAGRAPYARTFHGAAKCNGLRPLRETGGRGRATSPDPRCVSSGLQAGIIGTAEGVRWSPVPELEREPVCVSARSRSAERLSHTPGGPDSRRGGRVVRSEAASRFALVFASAPGKGDRHCGRMKVEG